LNQKNLAAGSIIERPENPVNRSHAFEYRALFGDFAVIAFEQAFSSGKPARVMHNRRTG
jgi:hypothetical protein